MVMQVYLSVGRQQDLSTDHAYASLTRFEMVLETEWFNKRCIEPVPYRGVITNLEML